MKELAKITIYRAIGNVNGQLVLTLQSVPCGRDQIVARTATCTVLTMQPLLLSLMFGKFLQGDLVIYCLALI